MYCEINEIEKKNPLVFAVLSVLRVINDILTKQYVTITWIIVV